MTHIAPRYYVSTKLDTNLYYYAWQGQGNNCNSCLFTNVLPGNKPHIIIDPGHTTNELNESCFSYFESAIAADGFNIGDIGLIINTHSHSDHCQANAAIIEKTNSRIVLTREEEEFRHTLGFKMNAMFGMPSPAFTTSQFIEEGNINLGTGCSIELQALITPGHSPGSVCLFWPDKKILITGDVVFYGSIGRTDFPGGNTAELEKSIEKLASLDVECIAPGHNTMYGSLIKGKKLAEANFQAIRSLF